MSQVVSLFKYLLCEFVEGVYLCGALGMFIGRGSTTEAIRSLSHRGDMRAWVWRGVGVLQISLQRQTVSERHVSLV